MLTLALLTACGGPESVRTGQGDGTPAPDQMPVFSTSEAEGGDRIQVDSDARARYYVLQRGGTRQRPTLLTKRIGSSGVSYSLREFDCAGRRVRYLGTGDTRATAEAGRPDANLAPIVDGAIPSFLIGHACDR